MFRVSGMTITTKFKILLGSCFLNCLTQLSSREFDNQWSSSSRPLSKKSGTTASPSSVTISISGQQVHRWFKFGAYIEIPSRLYAFHYLYVHIFYAHPFIVRNLRIAPISIDFTKRPILACRKGSASVEVVQVRRRVSRVFARLCFFNHRSTWVVDKWGKTCLVHLLYFDWFGMWISFTIWCKV